MNRRQMLALLGLIPITATAAPVVQHLEQEHGPRKLRPVTGFHGEYFPNVMLRTHDGERVRLYDDLLQGKCVVVHFFHAECRDDVCPAITGNLAQLHRLLGARCGRDVFMHSFSLAPGQDSPERLKRHHERLKAGPGWTFLTGSARDLALCRARFGLVEADRARDRSKTQHTNVVLIGNEPRQCWIASPAMTSAEYLLDQLNRVAGLKL